MKSDFEIMTMKELKKYVLQHRNDEIAFQTLIKRIDNLPQTQVYGEVDAQQFSTLLAKHRHSDKN